MLRSILFNIISQYGHVIAVAKKFLIVVGIRQIVNFGHCSHTSVTKMYRI
jgi:hypothetical protein